MKKLSVLSAMAPAAFLADRAHRHDTWLMPDRFEVAPRALVTLSLTLTLAMKAK
jgi:uncharacterized GH25 family protein